MYAQTMSFPKMAQILWARRRVFAAVWTTVVGITVVFCLTWPSKYTAVASVVVDVQSPDPVGNTMMAGSLLTSYMATQVDMLRSERVLLGAIRKTRLGDDAIYKEKWLRRTEGQGSYESWLSDEVLDTFVVKPTRGANSLTVEYRDRDPVRAAAMANAIVRSYEEVTLELRTQPAREFSEFFEAQSKMLRDKLEAAQSRLSAFQRERGLLVADERFDIETARLNQLSTDAVALQSAVAEADGRRKLESEGANPLPEVLNNAAVTQVTTDLNRAKAELGELQTRLGSNHPRVITAQANVAELESRVRATTAEVAQGTQAAYRVANSKLSATLATLNLQREKVLRLKADRDQAAVLGRDVENAQKAYEVSLDKAVQSQAQSLTRPTNISVIKDASVPGVPSFPKPTLMTAIAAVIGALMGVGAAMAREYFDQRVRGEDDVLQALNQPLLVRIPRHALRGKPASRRIAFQRRVLSGLWRPALR